MGNTKQKPSQLNQMNQASLIQIQGRGTINIIANLPQKFQISEMLASQPIFTSQNEFDDQFQASNPRKICQNSDQQPFCAIGLLFVQFTSKYYGYGTAFLIADNVVLTAAHNIYSREGNCSARQVNLIMEVHQKRRKTFRVVCAYVPKEYKQGKLYEEIPNNDFAILILGGSEELAKRKYGKIQLSSNVEVKDQVYVYGYPNKFSKEQSQQIIKFQSKNLQEQQNGDEDKIQRKKYLFSSRDEIVKLEIARIFYKANTSKGVSGSPVLRLNHSSLKYEAVGIHTTGHKIQNSGVRITNKVLTRIKQWVQAFWEGKENSQRVMLINKDCFQIVPAKAIQRPMNKGTVCITPDTTTFAWKQKQYRQDNINKNVCIYQGTGHEWLCSAQDLSSDGECVFTIRAHRVSKEVNSYGNESSCIGIGVMDSKSKGKTWVGISYSCVFLSIYFQNRVLIINQFIIIQFYGSKCVKKSSEKSIINFALYQLIQKPYDKKAKLQQIKSSCQKFLPSFPCLIKCHVNRQLNTITWHYNGKEQAKTKMPRSWKDGRKICAGVSIWWPDDCVQFM